MPYQWDEERPEPASSARKTRPLCGPVGRIVGLFTLVLALHGMLARTSLAASLLVAQTILPVTTHELMACLSLKCNSTLTAVGVHWSNPRNARLLKCLTHSITADAAQDCWSPDDTSEGRAVQSCAVHNYCVASPGSITSSHPVLPTPARPAPSPVYGSNPGNSFDWGKYLGAQGNAGWKQYMPSGTTSQGTALFSEPVQAAVSVQPVVPAEGNDELLACIKTQCPKQSHKIGVSWSNPVNTDLVACLANSNGGLAAAATCFPPVDPDHAELFQDSTDLRYCAMCASCIAGDRGSRGCEPGFKGRLRTPKPDTQPESKDGDLY